MRIFKIILLLLTVQVSVYAQVALDSTQVNEDTKDEPAKALSQSTTQPPIYEDDVVQLQQQEIPEALRNTLADPEYKGWETGKMYRSKNKDEYTLEINRANEKKRYHFDKQGKRLKDSHDH